MLECDIFAIQEHGKVLPAVRSFDIRNAATGELIGVALEQISFAAKLLRFLVSRDRLPVHVEVREKPDDSLVFSLGRSGYFFKSCIEVRDAMGTLVGTIKRSAGGFHVYDKEDKPFAEVEGELLGCEYRFLAADQSIELGQVSKKMLGLAHEVFFAADHYFLRVNPELSDQPLAKMLLLAAALA